jgi:hypothetical protein
VRPWTVFLIFIWSLWWIPLRAFRILAYKLVIVLFSSFIIYESSLDLNFKKNRLLVLQLLNRTRGTENSRSLCILYLKKNILFVVNHLFKTSPKCTSWMHIQFYSIIPLTNVHQIIRDTSIDPGLLNFQVQSSFHMNFWINVLQLDLDSSTAYFERNSSILSYNVPLFPSS